MKKLLFLLTFSVLGLVSAIAQPIVHSGTSSVTGTDSETEYVYPLKSNGDTVIVGQHSFAALAMTADSLTGGTAGTFILEACLTAANGTWYPIDTLTVNGVLSKSAVTTINPSIYRRYRGKLTTSGTQTTRGNLIYNIMNTDPN